MTTTTNANETKPTATIRKDLRYRIKRKAPEPPVISLLDEIMRDWNEAIEGLIETHAVPALCRMRPAPIHRRLGWQTRWV